MRLEPDKIRFLDPVKESNDRIHAVDLSDERSPSQFITIWMRGRDQEWMDANGMTPCVHAGEIYHRDDGPHHWVAERYGILSWGMHWHKDLEAPPKLEDIEPFAHGMSAGLIARIRAHFQE